jgi:predicted nucleotidyltransferase
MNTFDVYPSSFNLETKWVTVPARHSKSPTIVRDTVLHVSYEQLVEVLKTELYKYQSNIVTGYVYGSRARGANRVDSDADILIFWKKEMTVEDLQMIRNNIEAKLGFDIDFVSCVFAGKVIDHPDQRDIAYFENVALDAKQFIGSANSMQWLSECSKKGKNLSRK